MVAMALNAAMDYMRASQSRLTVSPEWRGLFLKGMQLDHCWISHLRSAIACYFRHAWEFELCQRCFETGLVIAPWPSADYQTETHSK